MTTRLLAIDQGTTSTRAIVFDQSLGVIGVAQQEFPQHFPRSGWVEHDPEDLWSSTVAVVKAVLDQTRTRAADVAALGITNQRETTIVWERATGKPIHNAIVWQDRRTADVCAEFKSRRLEEAVTARTGLVLDPYFSATKIAWILDHVAGARERASELAFGTVDSVVAAHRRARASHRCDQCVAQPAL